MIHSIIHYGNGVMPPFHRCVFILIASICFGTDMQGQFAPVAGFPGTTAIPYDSSAIVAWATGCTVQRGYRDIAVPDSGYASAGVPANAIGGATLNGVVSLGDGGSATLTFVHPIINGSGFDFAVFENGFNAGGQGLAFLELAFVEVSSDGVRYVRFPATDNVQDSIQLGNAGTIDGSMLNNLAGKYTYGYGTPFDLDELKDSAGLDVNNITHVKVIDAIGTLDPLYASHDSKGHMVNDPYPTNFASTGFDLDAVGVIHMLSANSISDITIGNDIKIFPNPTRNILNIQSETQVSSKFTLTTVSGQILKGRTFQRSLSINLSDLTAGTYIVKVIDQDHSFSKLIVKD